MRKMFVSIFFPQQDAKSFCSEGFFLGIFWDLIFNYSFFFVGWPHEGCSTEDHPGNLTILLS